MKTVFLFLTGILLFTIFPSQLFSQCAPGAGPYALRYDTTVIGNGSEIYSFSLRKFNIPLGTLLSADIKSVVNLQYSYPLENTAASSQIFKAKIVRSDDISSTALDPSSLNGTNQLSSITYTLAPSQLINYGPAYGTYTVVNESITTINPRLINFEGIGNVVFDYETSSTNTFQLGINFNPVVVDTIHFSISYLYCLNTLLSSDLLFFTAIPQSKNNVLLNWRQATIEAGRLYGVQVSTDGQTFTNISTVAENSTGAYAYTYLNNSSANKLFFRIQEKNVSGEMKYSDIRMVAFNNDTKGGVHIYPTLYTGGNLRIDFPEKSNWQIRLYSGEGKKIAEMRQAGAYTTQLLMPGGLSNGMYMVDVLNTQTQQRQIEKIIIQR
ncbi:MAG TPA: T9SS type A sorting domain-containing protein [Chitinophagaceae bacterium]|nr:T9SS type A sorting domain-containing protein [Chitinophagaceae bacterium]